jgi:hypothetical protein
MNRLTGLIAVAPVALLSSLVFADDSMGRVTPTDSQLMKQCMERQKTDSNVSVSKADAKRFCKDELKRQKATGASSERQPVDAPRAPASSMGPTDPPPAAPPPAPPAD